MTVKSRRFARNAFLTTTAGLAIGIPCLWPEPVDLKAQEAAVVRGQSSSGESKNPFKRLFGAFSRDDEKKTPDVEVVEIPQSVQITGDEGTIITKLFGEAEEEPEQPSRRDLRRQSRYARKHPYAARIAAQKKQQAAELEAQESYQETYEEMERLSGGELVEEVPYWSDEVVDLTPHSEMAPPVEWPDEDPALTPPKLQASPTAEKPAETAAPAAADDPFPVEETTTATPALEQEPNGAPAGGDDLFIPFPDEAPAAPSGDAVKPEKDEAAAAAEKKAEPFVPPAPDFGAEEPAEESETEAAPARNPLGDVRTASTPSVSEPAPIAPPPPAESAVSSEAPPAVATPGPTVPSGLGGPLMVRSAKSSTVVEPQQPAAVENAAPPAPVVPPTPSAPPATAAVEPMEVPEGPASFIPPAPEDFGDSSVARSSEIPDLFPMTAAPPAPEVEPREAPGGNIPSPVAAPKVAAAPAPAPAPAPPRSLSTAGPEPDPIVAPSTARRIEAPALLPAPRDTASKLERIASRKGISGLKGFCPVALRDDRNLLDARPEYSSVFNGKRYYFSSGTALAMFETHPDQYAPAASGNDVVHMALTGEAQQGSLDHAVWFRGKLYLFSSAETLETFVAAPSIHAAN
jgi:YHS domain-containing protein